MPFKLTKIRLVLVICLALSGCASSTKLYLRPFDNQQQLTQYYNGEPVLTINKQVSVSFSPIEVDKSGSRFGLLVENKSDKSFDLSTDNIKAILNENEIHVLTFEELQERIERARRRRSMALAFSGGLRSMGAGLQGGAYQQGAYNYYSNNGTSGRGTYSGYTYDSLDVQRQQQQITNETKGQIAQVHLMAENQKSESQTMLRRTTVNPGGTLFSIVYFDGFECTETYTDRLHIIISILGEDYVFDLTCGSVFKK